MNTLNYIVKRCPPDTTIQSLSNVSVFSFEINTIEQLLNFDFKSIHNSSLFKNKLLSISLFINIPSFKNTSSAAILKDIFQQLFFHTSYLKPNNQPVLFIAANLENDLPFKHFLSELNTFSILNGFEKTKCLFLNNVDQNTTQYIYTFKDELEFEKTYHELISKSHFCANYLNITNASNDLLLKIDASIKRVENAIERENPFQYMLLKKAFADTQKISELEDALKFISEDLNNTKTYLNIFKSQDESKKIKDFYTSEYEVLPLWYKQFGHILKVLIGKRTFKSLFNNNYKNK